MLDALQKVGGRIKVNPPGVYAPIPGRRAGRLAYLPVEVASRELASKANLAGDLVRRGFKVVLGATWNIACNGFTDLPPGILLFKTLNALDAEKMRMAQEAGHLTAVLNEEFFPLRLRAEWYRTECNDNALRLTDLLCAHGEPSAKILRTLTDARVEITGNPRTELPKLERGRDILVCTMAGTVNSALPFQDNLAMICKAFAKPLVGDLLELLQQQVIHEWTNLALTLETVQKLSACFPDRRIVLRPHPVENRTIYGAGGNVVMDTASAFMDSLKQAAVLVFISGCSTGVESFLSGIPGVRLGEGGHGISCDLHMGASTADDAVAAVAAQLESPKIIGDLSEHFAPVALAEKLNAFQKENAAPLESPDIEEYWRRGKNRVVPQEFTLRKFPNTDADEIARLTGASVKTLGWNT